MTDFTITIEDPAHLFALTAATDRYNAGLEKDATPLDAAGYLQRVVDKACASWANDFPMPDKAAYQAALDELTKAERGATGKLADDIAAAKLALSSVKEAAAIAVAAEAVDPKQ